MRQISSTLAKQNFGDLLRAAAQGPVAIGRHRKVQAIVASPEFFAASDPAATRSAVRRLERANQAIVERDRLIKHQRIAVALLTSPAKERNRMIRRARATVEQWRRLGLCSDEYIERWSGILGLPAREMALAITTDTDEWGPALRQNSPWTGFRG